MDMMYGRIIGGLVGHILYPAEYLTIHIYLSRNKMNHFLGYKENNWCFCSVILVFCCEVLQNVDRCVLLLLLWLCDARHEVPH